MNHTKILFKGYFDPAPLADVIASIRTEQITAVFDGDDETHDGYDFVFICNKAKNTFEIIDAGNLHTVKIKIENQSIENAISILLTAMYGETYVGIDWKDMYLALFDEQEAALFIGGISENELFGLKDKYKNTKGAFLHITMPINATLEFADEVTRRFANCLHPDADFAWTLTFKENLTENVFDLFIRKND